MKSDKIKYYLLVTANPLLDSVGAISIFKLIKRLDVFSREIKIFLPGFHVKRVYYLYDVPGGENRGSHAHKELSQLIIAASGSFTVTLDDGKCKRSFFLNRPYQGLYVKPGMWRDLEDFSSGAVCMVLASDVYKVNKPLGQCFSTHLSSC